jgi:hypothetical protein
MLLRQRIPSDKLSRRENNPINRRHLIKTAALSAASSTTSSFTRADDAELQPLWAQIEKRRDESLRRLQDWIGRPAIAAYN